MNESARCIPPISLWYQQYAKFINKIRNTVCTFAFAKVHVAYFISANYGFFTNYPFSAAMGVFQNSAC